MLKSHSTDIAYVADTQIEWTALVIADSMRQELRNDSCDLLCVQQGSFAALHWKLDESSGMAEEASG